jgi:hypothetical protein
MRAVSENPEWTRKDFAKAKRFDEVFPALARTIRRRGKQKGADSDSSVERLTGTKAETRFAFIQEKAEFAGEELLDV